jgi:hypothetical protein
MPLFGGLVEPNEQMVHEEEGEEDDDDEGEAGGKGSRSLESIKGWADLGTRNSGGYLYLTLEVRYLGRN